MKRRPFLVARPRCRGFTLIELVTVLGIIAILASILFPVFARAREKARTASCLSNLMQLTLALHMYAQDSGGAFPPAGRGAKESVFPYVGNGLVFICPSTRGSQKGPGAHDWGSYHYYPGHTNDGDPHARLLSDREFVHNGQANVALVEGGAASLLPSEWTGRGWKLPKKTSHPDDGADNPGMSASSSRS